MTPEELSNLFSRESVERLVKALVEYVTHIAEGGLCPDENMQVLPTLAQLIFDYAVQDKPYQGARSFGLPMMGPSAAAMMASEDPVKTVKAALHAAKETQSREPEPPKEEAEGNRTMRIRKYKCYACRNEFWVDCDDVCSPGYCAFCGRTYDVLGLTTSVRMVKIADD